MQLVLASQSPRRRQLIQLVRMPVIFCSADADEHTITTPNPAQNAIDTALLKAEAVAPNYPNNIIIGADTNVAFGDLILGKPHDADHAFDTLGMLRGRKHQVHSGLAIINTATGKTVTSVSSTAVQMRHLTDTEIRAYIATGDPMDKAGAYAIQHEMNLVEAIDGCYAGVVGLSLCDLADSLSAVGVSLERDVRAICERHHALAADNLSRMMAYSE